MKLSAKTAFFLVLSAVAACGIGCDSFGDKGYGGPQLFTATNKRLTVWGDSTAVNELLGYGSGGQHPAGGPRIIRAGGQNESLPSLAQRLPWLLQAGVNYLVLCPEGPVENSQIYRIDSLALLANPEAELFWLLPGGGPDSVAGTSRYFSKLSELREALRVAETPTGEKE